MLPGGHQRGGGGDEPADRRGLRHVVLPLLQPLGLGRGHLDRRVRGLEQPRQPGAAAQPGHRRALHAGIDLQAQHGDRRPRLGALERGRYLRRRGTFSFPGCKTNTGSCTPLHNSEGEGGFGSIDITTALTVSSDDFFYNLGALFYGATGKYGPTPIQDFANAYSLGEQTGIDLPGETTAARVDSQAERVKLHAENPVAFPNTYWYTGDNVEMAFGQGGTVITPIEQAVAYATFANGGTRYAPQVAAAIVSSSGKVVKRFTPQVVGHVNLPPSTFQPMLAGFEGAVNSPNGTAYGVPGLGSFPGGVAGKTGTADTEPGKEPTGWFVGFGPINDPQYVVVCVIDQAGFGVTASAPVVGQIYNYLASHPVTAPAIPPQSQIVKSTTPVPLPVTTPPTTTPAKG